MCRYTTTKKAEAPVECIVRISQPQGTSRMMYSTEANATAGAPTTPPTGLASGL
ncbi:hypothetical protein D3C72_2539240 [compost metagenome]